MSLFSTNQLDILSLLFAHSGEEYYLSEIGEILEKRPGVFQRGINALQKEGIIKSRKKGNQRLFSINTEYALFNEIQSIVNKTCGAEGALRNFVNAETKISKAIVFGSYAKNALNVNSDIDLLLVTNTENIDDIIIEKLSQIEKKLQREINYKIYVTKEFQRKIAANDPFLKEILDDKYILLKGKI